MNVQERIRGYFDRVEDIDYLKKILSEIPLPGLFEGIIQLVQSTSRNDVGRVDLFVRDVLYRTSDKEKFRIQLAKTDVPAAYVKNVTARDAHIRGIALSTLCTFYEWWSQKEINAALAFFEANDPTLLPRLAKHIMSRNHWEDWSLLERLTSNEDFLLRWSTLEILDDILSFPLPKQEILSNAKSCLKRLHCDVNEMVRIEADFLSGRVEYYEIMPTLPKAEKRTRSKALNKATPHIRFDTFRMFVGSQLGARQKKDFAMRELHDLAELFQKSK